MEGSDVLIGGPGSDDITGGTGSDVCDLDDGDEATESCRFDFAGPTVVSLTAQPEAVTVGDELTINLRLSDPSGVVRAGVYFMVRGVQNDFCGQQMDLVSGTDTDGTWRLRCTVPATVRNGKYTVTPFAQDRMNNYTNTNGGDNDETRATFTVS
jgi:hypothetical protein